MKHAGRELLTIALLLVITSQASAKSYIHLGTVAPEGSPWHEILLETRERWMDITDGEVVLRIYPSGVHGDETDMLRKVRIGQLQSVALTVTGLSRIDPGVSSLIIPMMIDSYDELDYVLSRITPEIEQRLEEEGFVVLSWSDVGWVHFFTKSPARTPDDIREMKLFTNAGDPEMERIYKELGFNPIPLAVTDLFPSLQTGLVDAFDVPPLFALLNQSFGIARNMLPIKWAPLMGATVVSRRAWERLPEEWRAPMLEAAREASASRQGEIRKMGEDAISEMALRGLNIVEVDDAVREIWQAEALAAYPRLRGRVIPEDLFDEVERLHREFVSFETP